MRIVIIIFVGLICKTTFAQDTLSTKILGTWYTCGWIDSLQKVKTQKFVNQILTTDSCRDHKCQLSYWVFNDENGEKSFYKHATDGCLDENFAQALIADKLSWRFDFARQTLAIVEYDRVFTFKILSLTNSELVVQLQQ
jgi:hypothetical protein